MIRRLRITVGVDAERASRHAVDWAIRQAISQPAEITLLTAFDTIMVAPVEEEAHLAFERARIAASAPDAIVETRVVEGTIDDILSRSAERSDLLVIGSHRTRHSRSVLTGNLPARVARRARCPVVIVPDDWEPRDGAVVVGLDDDASSDAALRRAAGFARDSGQELRVLHAWMRTDPPSDPVTFYTKVPKGLRDEHRDHLADAVHALRRHEPRLAIREDLYEGKATNGLLAIAKTAELVVIGSHRRGAIAGLLLGSVARDLLHHCRAPLCVVPSKRPVRSARPAERDEALA